jgi:hypothetical protein
MGGKCRFEVDQASLFETAKVGASKCLGEQIASGDLKTG